MIPKLSDLRPLDLLWASIATAGGVLVIYLGDMATGVKLEVFKGVLGTFTPLWIISLIVVPFIAGMVVSAIYGLGGKMLAHFAPLFVRIPEFILVQEASLPDGISALPVGYWILVLIVTVEASAGGGIVGEIIIKKTYGRRPKYMVHKRYQVNETSQNYSDSASVKPENSN